MTMSGGSSGENGGATTTRGSEGSVTGGDSGINTGAPTGGRGIGGSNATTGGIDAGSPAGGTDALGGQWTCDYGCQRVGGGSSIDIPPSGGTIGISATGGSSSGNTANNSAGGVATGGKSATGGVPTGGTATGGKPATGGVAAGGAMPAGGAATGGASTASTATSDPCSVTSTLSGGTKHCSQSDSGSYGSYQWRVWSNQTGGCLTTYANAGGAFSANWDNLGDFLAGVGLKFDDTQTYQQLGVFSADFAETHTGTAGALSYIGIYGWMVSPSIEFYIVEDSFDNSPPAKPAGGSKLGTIQADGGTYDVYSSALTGTTTTRQFYSIRQTSRRCGHISISDHFSQWANLGLSLGKMDEVRIIVEALGGTGSIDFTTASVVIN